MSNEVKGIGITHKRTGQDPSLPVGDGFHPVPRSLREGRLLSLSKHRSR